MSDTQLKLFPNMRGSYSVKVQRNGQIKEYGPFGYEEALQKITRLQAALFLTDDQIEVCTRRRTIRLGA